jgi:hypothetical protein
VALPCGHALCVKDFKRLGGKFLVPRRPKNISSGGEVVIDSTLDSLQISGLTEDARSTNSGYGNHPSDSDTQNAQILAEVSAPDNRRVSPNTTTEPLVNSDFMNALDDLRVTLTSYFEGDRHGNVADAQTRYSSSHPENVTPMSQRINSELNLARFTELDFSDLLNELRNNVSSHLESYRSDQIPSNEASSTLDNISNLYETRNIILNCLALYRRNHGRSDQQSLSNSELMSHPVNIPENDTVAIQRLRSNIMEYLDSSQTILESRNSNEQVSSTLTRSPPHRNRMTLDEYFNSRQRSGCTLENRCQSRYNDIDSLASLRVITQPTDRHTSNSDAGNVNENDERFSPRV